MTKPKTRATLKLQLGHTSYCAGEYELGSRKAKWRTRVGFSPSCDPVEYITGFCGDEFERITGLALKKGEVHNVTIKIRLEP